MDEDRIAGTARKLGGKVQEEVGRFGGEWQIRQLVPLKTYMGRLPTPPEIVPQRSTNGSVIPSKLSRIRPL